jgi:hypothetical protein
VKQAQLEDQNAQKGLPELTTYPNGGMDRINRILRQKFWTVIVKQEFATSVIDHFLAYETLARSFGGYFLTMKLYSMLNDYLESSNDLKFNQSAFNTAFEKLVDDLSIYNIKRTVSILENYTQEDNIIEIEDHARIRKISETERARLANMTEFASPFTFGGIHFSEALLEVDRVSIILGHADTAVIGRNPKEVIANVITILRLLKSGNFGVSKIFESHTKGFEHGYAGSISDERFLGEKYDLLSADKERFLNMLGILGPLVERDYVDKKENSYLKIALSRFDDSYKRRKLQDKLADFMIALEALYLSDNKELTYKLSLRVAILLGKNEEDRKRIRRDVSSLYELRSDIFHGGDKPIKEEQVRMLEEFLRLSLVKFLLLSRYFKKQELMEKFDESLMDEKIRMELTEKSDLSKVEVPRRKVNSEEIMTIYEPLICELNRIDKDLKELTGYNYFDEIRNGREFNFGSVMLDLQERSLLEKVDPDLKRRISIFYKNHEMFVLELNGIIMTIFGLCKARIKDARDSIEVLQVSTTPARHGGAGDVTYGLERFVLTKSPIEINLSDNRYLMVDHYHSGLDTKITKEELGLIGTTVNDFLQSIHNDVRAAFDVDSFMQERDRLRAECNILRSSIGKKISIINA